MNNQGFFVDRFSIPFLGTGIGYRKPYLYPLVETDHPITFLEVIADHFIGLSSEKKAELSLLKKKFCLIPHAINASLGHPAGPSSSYLEEIAEVVAYIDPPYWSEHIAFTHTHTTQIGHLTPLIRNQQTLDILSHNVERVRSYIKKPLILENISYLFHYPFDEWEEAEFISKVLESTDTGLLLDLTNTWYNSKNTRYTAHDFIENLPLERIVQFHFSGGFIDADGVAIDAHNQPVPQEVYSLTKYLSKKVKIAGSILERDSNLPPFSELCDEVQKISASILPIVL